MKQNSVGSFSEGLPSNPRPTQQSPPRGAHSIPLYSHPANRLTPSPAACKIPLSLPRSTDGIRITETLASAMKGQDGGDDAGKSDRLG